MVVSQQSNSANPILPLMLEKLCAKPDADLNETEAAEEAAELAVPL